MGIINYLFRNKIKELNIDDHNNVNSDLILENVVQLSKAIWKDTTLWKKNLKKMEHLSRMLLSHYSDDTRALINLGAILSDQGKHRQALKVLFKAEKLDSIDANLYKNIGIAKMNISSERNNAKKYFKKAQNLKPDKFTIEAYYDPHAH